MDPQDQIKEGTVFGEWKILQKLGDVNSHGQEAALKIETPQAKAPANNLYWENTVLNNLGQSDVKPHNFMSGLRENENTIYVIDFGTVESYMSGGEHVPSKKGKGAVGTPRFASVNVHKGFKASRRDDLEALGYMLLYFLKGTPAEENETNAKVWQRVGALKEKTNIAKECAEWPELAQFITQTRNMQFEEEPDYAKLKSLFANALQKKRLTSEKFDWDEVQPAPNKKRKSSSTSAGTPAAPLKPSKQEIVEISDDEDEEQDFAAPMDIEDWGGKLTAARIKTMTVAAMKKELSKRKLSTTGLKADLMKRLLEHLE